jgi:hypothetical protein
MNWRKNMELDNVTFGLTVTLIGMGGTVFSLWLLSILIDLIKKIFPYKESKETETK